MIKKIILTGILGLLSIPSIAQSIVNYESYWDNYLIRNIDREDGLFRDEVYDTYQDSSGFIWIANYSFLFKYDGLRLLNFNQHSNDIGNAQQLLENKKGELLILSVEDGIITKKKDSLITKRINSEIEFNKLTSVAFSKGDSMFVSSYGNGVSITYEDTVVATLNMDNGLIGNNVYKVIVDSKNRAWIATSMGLSVFENGKIRNISDEEGLPEYSVRTIIETSDQEIWVGTEKKGIIVFKDYEPIKYLTTNNGMSDNAVFELEENPIDSSIWIGFSNQGLDRFKNDRFDHLNEDYGLLSNHITSIRFDNQGNGYVGTEYGLSILMPRIVDVIDESTKNFPLVETFSVDQDSTGKIYVGTISGGLMVYENGVWENIRFSSESTSESVSVIKISDKDYNYVVTSEHGLVKYKNEEVIAELSQSSGLTSNYIVCLEEDKDKNLWVGTWDGFNIIDKEWNITDTLTINDPVPGEECLNMISDSEGDIWIATTNNGLFEMRGREVLSHYNTSNGLLSNRVYGLAVDSNNDIWAASLEKGFYRISNGVLTTYPGLPDNFVSITEDDFGNFWFSSNGFLGHVKKADLYKYETGDIENIPFQKYTEDDGFPSSRVTFGNSSLTKKISSGEILITTKKGLVVVNPQKTNLANESFFPYLESFLIDEKKVSIEEPIILRSDQKKIEISYSALNIRAPKKTEFRVRLEGIDEDWNYVGDRTTMYYDYLPNGKYTLEVSAIDPSGVWSNKTDSISFTVLPPFYKTWWFISLCLLGFVTLSAGGVQIRSNLKLKELNQKLLTKQRIQEERERISRDLHDNVGSQISNLITGIEISNLHVQKNQQDQALSLLGNLDSDARSAMTDLRETIWLLDKEEVEFGIFLDHLKGYVKRQGTYLKEMNVNIQSSVNQRRVLNPAQSLNLTRIIQEALNNARKYAQASTFDISFLETSEFMEITLKDNGIGMVLEDCLKKGNGINNMMERAKEINGKIFMESTIGKGTEINIEL